MLTLQVIVTVFITSAEVCKKIGFDLKSTVGGHSISISRNHFENINNRWLHVALETFE